MSAFKDLLAGSAGGVAQVLVGHPLDTIKVRLQTQPAPLPGQLPQYKGMMDCLMKTIKGEGVMGLYKGVGSPLVGLSAMNAVLFFTNGLTKRLFEPDPSRFNRLSNSQYLAAGAVTGVCVSFVESPMDLFKSKMQVQDVRGAVAGAPRYSNVFDCAYKIVKNFGVRGVYQGLGATFTRNIPANATYFGMYEGIRTEMLRRKGPNATEKDLSAAELLFAGGMGGIAYWFGIFPIDVIKSTMQTDHSEVARRTYRTVWQTGHAIVREQGLRGLYKGFTPCMIRAFPANAACFFAYEKARQFIG